MFFLTYFKYLHNKFLYKVKHTWADDREEDDENMEEVFTDFIMALNSNLQYVHSVRKC